MQLTSGPHEVIPGDIVVREFNDVYLIFRDWTNPRL